MMFPSRTLLLAALASLICIKPGSLASERLHLPQSTSQTSHGQKRTMPVSPGPHSQANSSVFSPAPISRTAVQTEVPAATEGSNTAATVAITEGTAFYRIGRAAAYAYIDKDFEGEVLG